MLFTNTPRHAHNQSDTRMCFADINVLMSGFFLRAINIPRESLPFASSPAKFPERLLSDVVKQSSVGDAMGLKSRVKYNQ
jgi:hypothetical protein